MTNKLADKMQKITGARLALAVLGLGAAILFVVGLASPFLIDCSGAPAPVEEAAAFFGYLSAGDYAAADRYVYEYATLGFDNDPVMVCGHDLAALLRESRRVEITGSGIKGQTAAVDAEFTTLDFRMIRDELDRRLAALDVTPQGDSVEDALRRAAEIALGEMLQNPEDFYTSAPLALQLKKQGGTWKVVINGELNTALTGYAAEV